MIETTEAPPTDPSPPPGRRRYYLSAFVCLFVLSILGSYPAYLLWQKYRFDSQLHLAQGHLEKEEWEKAYGLLSQLYNNSQTNPAVLQMIAHLMRQTNPDPSRALFFWKQFVAYGSPTTEDWAEIGKAFLADGQPDEAVKIFASFSPEQRKSRYAIDLESQLLYFQGKTLEADSLRREFLLKNPHDPENELNLAIMDLNNPFTEVQKSAFETLWKIARSKNRQSLAALQAIANSPLLGRGTSSELLKLALENEGVSAKNYFKILHRYLLLNPEKREETLATETVRHQNKTIQESALFYHWLLQERAYDLVLELVPKEKATKNELLFPVYVEALAGKARWSELNTIFRETPSIPISPAEQSVLHARIAHGQRNNDSIVSGHLKEACRRALTTKNMESLQRIVTIADELGFDEVTIEALNKASAIPQYQMEMLERLLAIYARHNDAESMLTTLQKILEAKPMMTGHLENSIYLKLLLGKEFETIFQNTTILADQGRISRDSSVFIHALLAYRFHDMERLKGLLTEIDPNQLPVGQRAVYAGMLASCGERAQAFLIAEKIAPALLLQGELYFLHKSL